MVAGLGGSSKLPSQTPNFQLPTPNGACWESLGVGNWELGISYCAPSPAPRPAPAPPPPRPPPRPAGAACGSANATSCAPAPAVPLTPNTMNCRPWCMYVIGRLTCGPGIGACQISAPVALS